MLIADYPPFRPNFWLPTGHLQTIAPLFLGGKCTREKADRHIVRLFDGDRLVIHDDKPDNWISGDRIVIVLHGLVGCHGSPSVVRLATKLQRHGIRTVRVDMRGFGDSTYISRSHLNGGCSPDLESVIEFMHQISPLSAISVIGFSIGGNIVLKTAGEWGDVPPRHVDSVVAVSPPVDLSRTMWNLTRFGNRMYERYFMRRLSEQLSLRRRKVRGLIDNGLNPLPDKMVHFDDEFTAPIWGYSGAREYYEQCSSIRVVKDITVPTIVLTSRDDPVIPIDMLRECERSPQVEVVETRTGGHLGFISRGRRDPDRYWMDWRISQWIASIDEPEQ